MTTTDTLINRTFDKRYVSGWFRSAGARGLAHLVRQLSSAVVCCSNTVAAQFGAVRVGGASGPRQGLRPTLLGSTRSRSALLPAWIQRTSGTWRKVS